MWLQLLEVFFIILIALCVCVALILTIHYPSMFLRHLALKVRDYFLRSPR